MCTAYWAQLITLQLHAGLNMVHCMQGWGKELYRWAQHAPHAGLSPLCTVRWADHTVHCMHGWAPCAPLAELNKMHCMLEELKSPTAEHPVHRMLSLAHSTKCWAEPKSLPELDGVHCTLHAWHSTLHCLLVWTHVHCTLSWWCWKRGYLLCSAFSY